jgi:hypothetical protein
VQVWWLHADADGETHLREIALPAISGAGEGGVDRVAMLSVPAVGLGLASLRQRAPDLELHAAPKRRFLVMMRGEHEITTTDGQSVCLVPGDCIFVDDVGSKGHYSKDTGAEPMAMAAVDVPDDWQLQL